MTFMPVVPVWDREVRGFVKHGWEGVKKEFEMSMMEGRDIGAQVAVYNKGELVVSLASGSALINNRDWSTGSGSYSPKWVDMTEDMVHPLFSSTKVAESTVIAMLADRGRLDVKGKVKDLWPEFANGGKEDLMVQDIMRHQGALASPARGDSFKLKDFEDLDEIGKKLARQKTNWDLNEVKHQMYHPVTRGMYSGEIARRADKGGRGMGEYFRQEVANKYGLKFFLGINESEWNSNVVSEQLPPPYLLLLKYIPQYIMGTWVSERTRVKLMGGDKHDALLDYEADVVWGFAKKFFTGQAYLNMAAAGSVPGVVEGLNRIEDINDPRLLKLDDMASANGLANAESMAKLGDLIRSGELFDVSGPAMEKGERVPDEGIGFDVAYTACGFGDDRFKNAGLSGWQGWAGMGGSVLQWNDEKEISVGYNTVLPYMRVGKPRGNRLMRAAFEAAGAKCPYGHD